jgi:hypothetical protein
MALAGGTFGGPGLPGRTRIGKATMVTDAVMEQDSMGRFIKEIDRKGDNLMDILADKMEERATALAPVRTGRLRRSMKGVVMPGGREARLLTDVPYAIVMEDGSRPHLIHGVKANFRWKNGSRRFIWNDPRFGPVDGMSADEIDKVNSSDHGYVNWSQQYGATVRHPGTKPRKFMFKAWEATWLEARLIMREVYK